MEVQIHVENMTCHNCTKILRSALSPIPGVSGITIKKPQRNILVQFDPNIVTLNHLVETINQKGYSAELLHARKELESE
jgi:copper chaperone CopZ